MGWLIQRCMSLQPFKKRTSRGCPLYINRRAVLYREVSFIEGLFFIERFPLQKAFLHREVVLYRGAFLYRRDVLYREVIVYGEVVLYGRAVEVVLYREVVLYIIVEIKLFFFHCKKRQPHLTFRQPQLYSTGHIIGTYILEVESHGFI